MKLRDTILAYGTPEGVSKGWDTRGRGRKQTASFSREEVGILQEHLGEAVKEENKVWADALARSISGDKHTPQQKEALLEHWRDTVKEGFNDPVAKRVAAIFWRAYKQ